MAVLRLGSVSFTEFELPDTINFGGKQQVAIHKMIGGSRVVEAMGPEPDPVTWSGRFRGPNAMSRAKMVDQMRAAGAQLPLYYLNTFVTVVITEFKATPLWKYEVPYTITCTVVSDNVNSVLGTVISSIDTIVSSALTVAAAFSDPSADSNQAQASSYVSSVYGAVDAAGSLNGAAQSALVGLSKTVYASSTGLGSLATTLDATLGVGVGTAAGTDPDQMSSYITGQLSGMQDEVAALGSKDNIDLIYKNLLLARA